MQHVHEMARIAQPHQTVSDKIRALDGAGYPRAEIARFLKKRYQHVRNVLEADSLKREMPSAPPNQIDGSGAVETLEMGEVVRLIVAGEGSLGLSKELLAALQVRAGEPVMAEIVRGGVMLRGWRQSAEWAREQVRRHVPEDVSLVDELLAERRREVARENAKFAADG